jgi:uncharacterized membrane protein
MENSQQQKLANRRFFIWSLVGAALVFLVWAVSGFIVYRLFSPAGVHGTVGDMFGAVNALFSGWAFLGVIIAIILQKQEPEEQRAEIRHTRIAQQDSARALQAQLEPLETHAKIDALNHIINGLSARIQRAANYRTETERKRHDQMVIEQERYENQLRNLVDRFLKAEE